MTRDLIFEANRDLLSDPAIFSARAGVSNGRQDVRSLSVGLEFAIVILKEKLHLQGVLEKNALERLKAGSGGVGQKGSYAYFILYRSRFVPGLVVSLHAEDHAERSKL